MRDTKAPFRATPKFGPLWSYKSALHKLRVHWSQMECCTFSSSFLTSIKFLLRFLETFFCSPNLNSPRFQSFFCTPFCVSRRRGLAPNGTLRKIRRWFAAIGFWQIKPLFCNYVARGPKMEENDQTRFNSLNWSDFCDIFGFSPGVSMRKRLSACVLEFLLWIWFVNVRNWKWFRSIFDSLGKRLKILGSSRVCG